MVNFCNSSESLKRSYKGEFTLFSGFLRAVRGFDEKTSKYAHFIRIVPLEVFAQFGV